MEKDKMINGEIYNPNDKELSNDRLKSKTLCIKYNQLLPNQTKEKEKILNKVMGPHEGFRIIEPDFFCDYGYNITTGKDFYINHNCVILDCAKVTFGKNVCIGPNCGFYTPEHPLKAEERIKDLEWAKPITIGDNVWLGGNVTVLAGVTIGDNAVIGAGSVVVKDIPSNVVAVGNPCKPIKNIDQ